ncbi:hypothetical protein MTP99_013856 [Tenebrio molitor]|nr:hypothetical protein MTP99_013856 [Tenebrio molitor]
MWGRCGRNVKDIPSVVGRENVWNLAIADDLVIVEKSEKRKPTSAKKGYEERETIEHMWKGWDRRKRIEKERGEG